MAALLCLCWPRVGMLIMVSFPLQTRSCVEPGYAVIVVTVNVGKSSKHNPLADTK